MTIVTADVVDDETSLPAVIEPLTFEEAALAAIMLDPSGLDQAEFLLVDQSKPDLCYRAKPFQWPWWRSREPRQMDQASRDVGKSEGLMLRCLAFWAVFPGEEMTIFTPEFTHINRIAERIEARIITSWFYRALTRPGRSGITHRPFCVAAGQVVLTSRGMVPIEDVVVGDEVLTHRNRWRPVTAVHDNGIRDTVELQGMGHPGLRLTPDHRVYARRSRQKERPGRPRANGTPTRVMDRVMQEPEWVAPQDWRRTDPATRWGSPAAIPEIAAVPDNFRLNKRGFGVGRGAEINVASPEFMWFVGHYLAEGCLRRPNPRSLSLGIHESEASEVLARLEAAGLHGTLCRPGQVGREVSVGNQPLIDWVARHLPGLAHEKQIPVWAYSMKADLRQALLEGYLYGDGHLTKLGHQAPGTASRALAFGVRLLALSLGWGCGMSLIPPATAIIQTGKNAGRAIHSGPHYRLHVNMDDPSTLAHVHTRFVDDIAWAAATKLRPAASARVFDLTVAEDHSYVVDGIIVHNCVFYANGARIISSLPQRSGIGAKGAHSVVVEIDEAQDLSPQAWKEIPNTISWEKPGAKWYIHGVSKGVRDDFHDYSTKPELGFTVHRITQMHREDWTEERRQQLIEEFGGSIDSPDYKRNVKGEHGDTANVIFILTKLMAGTDDEESSFFNQTEYTHFQCRGPEIESRVEAMGVSVEDDPIEASSERYVLAMQQLLDFPALHTERHDVFWAGMDVGLVDDPSEILIFADYHPDAAERRSNKAHKKAVPLDGMSRLKLVCRVSMRWIPAPLQADVIMWVIDSYKPRAFSMDSTGNGLPVFMELQKRAGMSRLQVMDYSDDGKIPIVATDARNRRRAQTREALTTIKGYNFCADEKTEILTKRGWLRHDEVHVGDETLGLTMDGTSRWTPITVVNVFDGPHEVHSLEGQAHSSVTTANHRWLAKPHTGNNRLGWFTTEELAAGRTRYGIPVAATRADNPTAPTIKDDLVELAGWYFTEGWIDKDGETISIGQSLIVNPLECSRIEALLTRMMGPGQFNPGRGSGLWGQGWTCSNSPTEYQPRNGPMSHSVENTYHVKDREICAAVRELVVGEDKVPSPEFLTSLTDDQLNLFVETCMLGDGSNTLMVRPGRTDRMTNFFHQENEDRSRAFEMACALRGQGFTHRLYKNQTCWTTNQLSRRQVWSSCMRHEVRTIEGVVWCPTTETGTWLARREGTVYFTGNSGKVICGFDQEKIEAMKTGASPQEVAEQAGLTNWVKQAATDYLRGIVDTQRHWLPLDQELLRQWNAQTWQYGQGGVTAYGNRKTYSNVKVHTLDAARMMILGRELEPIEMFLREPPTVRRPVLDHFIES